MTGLQSGTKMAFAAVRLLRSLAPVGRSGLPAVTQTHQIHSDAPRSSVVHAPVSKPEGNVTCTLIPGDGVGPELCNVIAEVFKAAGVPVDFETYFLSEIHYALSSPLMDVTNSIRRNGACLKGILQSPDYSRTAELKTLNMKLRDALDLYANVVHIRSLPGIPTRHQNLDFVVIREQTEGEYSALEHESVKGVVESLKITTKDKCMRIAKFAFDYATKHDRKKVTAVHKANIMKLGDGLFLRCCQEVSELYPDIEFNNMIVDNCTMQMVSNPHQFDVLVLPNLYGNIIDNLAAGLVGGAGVVAGSSYSSDAVVFEPGARHTFMQGVGKNVANPTAMLLCASNMLDHMDLQFHGNMIRSSVEKVIGKGKVKTKDVRGQSTTLDFQQAVISSLDDSVSMQ